MSRIRRTAKKGMSKLAQLNWTLVLLVLALTVIGVVMQYSAAGGAWRPWAMPQGVRALIGLALMVAMAMVDFTLLMRLAYPFYAFCLGLLVVVEVSGLIGMGAQRWIGFGAFNLQPSEFMKVALIMALARYFHYLRAEALGSIKFLIPPLLMMALPALLILRQPNLGTATILLLLGGAMLFMAGVWLRYFIVAILLVAAALPVGWSFLHDYQKQRVMTFLDPSTDPLGSGYNITQSMIAIGSGGVVGKGLLQGSQGQLDFLPEKQTDFIFTMLAEETGFIGCLFVMGLYAGLLLFACAVALRARQKFGSLLAVGVAAMLFVHIFINVAMVMGMIPVVGVPLPFLSYGGSFLLATLMASGLLMNAYVHRDQSLHRHVPAFF